LGGGGVWLSSESAVRKAVSAQRNNARYFIMIRRIYPLKIGKKRKRDKSIGTTIKKDRFLIPGTREKTAF